MRPTPAQNLPTSSGAPSTSPKVLANLPTVPGRSLVASPSPVATRGAISATPLPPTEAVEVASSTTEGLGLLAIDERGGVRAPIPAGPSPRLLPFLQERLVQWWRDGGRNKLHDVPFEVDRNLAGASRTWFDAVVCREIGDERRDGLAHAT